MALHVRKAKKPKKLTKEQKAAINKTPKTNAGVGWGTEKGVDPRAYEEGWGRGRS